ncbi:MAG: hypothetical protein ABH896_01900, partial [Candidatus Jacksonbacteria bacterium]
MFKYILKHIILDTLYFPIWWYSKGLLKILRWAKESLKDAERMAGLKIWIKAMFKPMFQDYTREGRIVSFFMRFVLLIFKLLMVIIWTAVLGLVILIWLGLPIGIVW